MVANQGGPQAQLFVAEVGGVIDPTASVPQRDKKRGGVRSRTIDSGADAGSPRMPKGQSGFRRSRRSYRPSRSRRSVTSSVQSSLCSGRPEPGIPHDTSLHLLSKPNPLSLGFGLGNRARSRREQRGWSGVRARGVGVGVAPRATRTPGGSGTRPYRPAPKSVIASRFANRRGNPFPGGRGGPPLQKTCAPPV